MPYRPFLLFILLAYPFVSVSNVRILAVVNKSPITSTDLSYKLKLISRGNPSSIPSEQRENLERSLLKQMINEKIQMYAVKESGITVTDEEVTSAIASAEKDNGMKPGQLLKDCKAFGIPESTLRSHFKARIGWFKFVTNFYQSLLRVSDEEVEEKAQQHKNDMRSLISEIVFPYDDVVSDMEAKQMADTVYQQLKQGAPFPDIAFEISQSPSSLSGGDIGWISHSQMSSHVRSVIESAPANSITSPVKTPHSYKIFLIRDRIDSNTSGTLIDARQLDIPLSAFSNPEKEIKILNKRLSSLTSCTELSAINDKEGLGEMHYYTDVRASELSTDLRNVISSLDKGQCSKGYMQKNMVSYIMVCNKKEGTRPIAKSKVNDQLMNERLSLVAEQKLQHMQRLCSIELRA